MTRAGDVYDRLREWEERGIPGRYHDRANTLSIMGCPRAKRVHWLVGWVQSRAVIEGVGLKQDCSQVQEALG